MNIFFHLSDRERTNRGTNYPLVLQRYLTSHMCDVSMCCVTSQGRIRLPSKGPIHVPVGMVWLLYTPYPSPAELETPSLHSGGSDLTA